MAYEDDQTRQKHYQVLTHLKNNEIDKIHGMMTDGEYDINSPDQEGKTALTHAITKDGQNRNDLADKMLQHFEPDTLLPNGNGPTPIETALDLNKRDLASKLHTNAKDKFKERSTGPEVDSSQNAGSSVNSEQSSKRETKVKSRRKRVRKDKARVNSESSSKSSDKSIDTDNTPVPSISTEGETLKMDEVITPAGLFPKEGNLFNVRSSSGETPLHYAAAYGDIETAQRMIDAGADVNKASKEYITPLHDAAAEGHTEMAELLVKNGANPKAVDAEGLTPKDVAEEMEFSKLSSTLERLEKSSSKDISKDNKVKTIEAREEKDNSKTKEATLNEKAASEHKESGVNTAKPKSHSEQIKEKQKAEKSSKGEIKR